MNDDRIMCTHCVDLTPDNRCRAARTRRRRGVGAEYGPPHPHELAHRCVFFAPMKGADDQRTGRERYSVLWQEYEALMAERAEEALEVRQRGVARAKTAIGR